jgi:hypothetical protein
MSARQEGAFLCADSRARKQDSPFVKKAPLELAVLQWRILSEMLERLLERQVENGRLIHKDTVHDKSKSASSTTKPAQKKRNRKELKKAVKQEKLQSTNLPAKQQVGFEIVVATTSRFDYCAAASILMKAFSPSGSRASWRV